jgi:hypothetical protein
MGTSSASGGGGGGLISITSSVTLSLLSDKINL